MEKCDLSSELSQKNLSGVPSIDQPWKKFYSPEMLNIKVPDMSLTDYLYEKNKNHMNLFALRYVKQKITYEELFDKIDKTSRRFQNYGVKEDDYVSLAMPLTPEAIYMMYALDNIGANANLIDPRVPEERMRYYLNLANSALSVVIRPYTDTMRKASKGTTTNRIISVSPLASFRGKEQTEILKMLYSKKEITDLVLAELKEKVLDLRHNLESVIGTGSKIVSYSDFENQMVGDLVKVAYKRGKTSIGEYTSGTTGVPKGLSLTAKGMNVTAEQLSMINNTTPGETVLGIMPPFISYGAVTGIHHSLVAGAEIILIPNFKVEEFANLVKKFHPNNIICVPSMFQYVMDSELMKEEDLSCIKRLVFGGDKTDPAFEDDVNQFLKDHHSEATVIKGGGMAEYSSCAFETPFEETKKKGVYGIPLPLMEVKIMKDDMTECGYYEVGEIYLSGPQEMKGYLNNPKATEEFFYIDENGKRWGRSGDLGFIDTDGVVTLTSRKKQMIVRPDGHNVFPNEIEEVILQNKAVQNCVVIGVRDENSISGEYPYAFVELKKEFLDQSEDLLETIKKEVAKMIPVRDRPKDEDYVLMNILYSAEGKVDRTEMVKTLKK